jgi:methyltransferase (TIGR00027 family)
MHESMPSRTALRVAMRRAAHQLLDSPRIFDDPLAIPILGPGNVPQTDDAFPSLRAFLVARSRYAEDQLSEAIARGVRQYVVLGAGLDTFACRNPHRDAGLRVFEVDHPATQQWKREQLAAARIPIPPEAVFVPVDFERQSLADGLASAGFHRDRPAFFSWLGVVPYLTTAAFDATLSYIAGMPPASAVVFDYAADRRTLAPREQEAFDALARRVALAGEPFRLFFDPSELAARLRQMGFHHIEDLGATGINARYSLDPSGFHVRGGAGHLLAARL